MVREIAIVANYLKQFCKFSCELKLIVAIVVVYVVSNNLRMTRDDETGQTVLHFFAAAADRRGRYKQLLERVLELEGWISACSLKVNN